MCYPVYGRVHIKEPLLLIGTSVRDRKKNGEERGGGACTGGYKRVHAVRPGSEAADHSPGQVRSGQVRVFKVHIESKLL